VPKKTKAAMFFEKKLFFRAIKKQDKKRGKKEYFMARIFKQLGIIALVVIIGFSMAVCGGGDGDGGTAPTITTATLPNGTVGTAYSQTLAATGDTPITWSGNVYFHR